MAPHITPKLERDASMPRCRNLSAFFGKRCLADHTEDPPSPKPSQKQQRRRPNCSKDGASAAPSTFFSHRSIQKLLSEPFSKIDPSVQSVGCCVQPLTQYEGVQTEGEILKESSSCRNSVLIASPCKEGASLQEAEVSLNLSEQMDSVRTAETKHMIDSKITEIGVVHKHSGVPEGMETSELQKCEAMEGDDREISTVERKAWPLQQTSMSSLQGIENSSFIEQEYILEQSKSDCDADESKMHSLEDPSVKICLNQQHAQVCIENQSVSSDPIVHSSQIERNSEVVHDALNACQELGNNLKEARPHACAMLLQSDGNKTAGDEICGSESDAGTAQINTIASSAAEEQELACIKDQQEGKIVEVERRRSSRIKKLFKSGEEVIEVPNTGSCMKEQEEPKLALPNSVHKIYDNGSTSTQSEFFLPASKRSKRQKSSAEETNTLVSNGREKRQRDGKLGQIQKGNSVMSCKQGSNNEDFFVPASKRHKQMLNTLDPMMKEEQEEKAALFQFDLWAEAKLAAEENAQLCVGKTTHPFFSQHRGGQRTSLSVGISANACSSRQASCTEEVELAPSPPFHITQLIEAEVGTTDTRTSSVFLQNLKVDQPSFRKECFDLTSKELQGLLRVPVVDKLSVAVRRNHTSRGVSLDNVLEPLLSFLKDSERVSKNQNTTEEEEFDFSLAYLKERLKSFLSDHAKRCSHDSCNMMSSSTDEGGAAKNSLWTNVYQPQSPKEVCGNRESVDHLSAWLERWQSGSAMTIGLSEGDPIRRKMSHNEGSDEDRSCFQEDSNSEDETREAAALQNVLFLAGPVGCGKTAAIYACARVHGYTVIEVNCSDNRNGLLIKQKFSESMESHCVGKWSADMAGPGNAPICTKRGASAAADVNAATSLHVTESEYTQHVSKQKRQKQKQKQKRKDDDGTRASKRKDDDATRASKVLNRAALNTDVGLALEGKQLDEPIECDKSMTVLLFEDVDMVFEDDRGFMAAVAQVAATAKRPIILTSNDKRLCLPNSLGAELLEFKRPSTKELVVLAYLVCVTEGIPCRPEFLLQMVKLCHHDLRILLNYLQFWSQGHANESSSEAKDLQNVAQVAKEAGMGLALRSQGHANESSSEIKDLKNVAVFATEAGMRFNLRSQEAESASVMKLFELDAQHRLWPSFVSLRFPCQVTQLVACKLNDMVSQVEKKFDIDEEKKLENHIVKKLALLKKLKRQKVDSPLKKVDREGVDDGVCVISTAELSDNLETPVKNLKEAKALARSPILREKLKKDLAGTMLGVADGSDEYIECDNQAVLQTPSKQDSVERGNHIEPLNTHLPGTCDSNGASSVIVASPIKNEKTADDVHMLVKECMVCRLDLEVEPIPPTDLTTESNELLTIEDLSLTELGSDSGESIFQSISEPIHTLWSEFRKMKEKQGLMLSSTSRESYSNTLCLSNLADNLSSCDVMSCLHGPGKMSLEDDAYCWGSPEDSSMLQAFSMFAHKSLMLCVEECLAMPNLPEEIRPTFSTEDMMLAVNDSCAVGKLFTDDGAFSSGGFQLQNVAPSHHEQESERYRRKSSLQRALYSELPSKAQVPFHGASFFEYASFLARIGRLELDRLTSGAARRRGRGFQNYFRTHPWNLSKESINILEQFGRFNTS